MSLFGPGKQDPKQRLEHREQASNSVSFILHTKGKTLDTLLYEDGSRTEKFGPIELKQGLGPKGFRYVYDPTELPGARGANDPGGVVDMKHFFNAASFPAGLGELAGAAVEEQQAQNPKTQGSARFEEDYKSNFLGAVFRNNYWKNDSDISDELSQFFSDYKQGELKGFVPAAEHEIKDLSKRGADGLKQLEQLKDMLVNYLQNSEPVKQLQQLWEKLSSVEQELKVAALQRPETDIATANPAKGTLAQNISFPQDGTPPQTTERSSTETPSTLVSQPQVNGHLLKNIVEERLKELEQRYPQGKQAAIAANFLLNQSRTDSLDVSGFQIERGPDAFTITHAGKEVLRYQEGMLLTNELTQGQAQGFVQLADHVQEQQKQQLAAQNDQLEYG